MLFEKLFKRKAKAAATEEALPELTLFDMHCHVGFAPDAAAVASAAQRAGVGLLSATVTPAEYEQQRVELAKYANVRVGLGLHPWWLADGRCGQEDVAAFERLAASERVIAEVGLDFGGDRVSSRGVQLAAFRRVATACAKPPADGGRRVISLHAFDSATEVLDILEETGCLVTCDCVFHWFSGSQPEIMRAVAAGCYFSINRRMLAMKRGFMYVRAIPLERLLLETDMPAKQVDAFEFAEQEGWLRTARETASKLYHDPRFDETVAATSKRLLFCSH